MKAPPVTLTAPGVLALGGLVALALAGAWLYSKRGAVGQAATAAVQAVNPADPQNLVNRGVTGAGVALTGDPAWTFGGQLAEWFSPEVRAANDALRGTAPTPAAVSGDSIRFDRLTRPADPAPGDSWSIGTRLADWFSPEVRAANESLTRRK